MTPRRILLAVALIVVVLVIWNLQRVAPDPQHPSAPAGATRIAGGSETPKRQASATAKIAERSDLADALNSSATDIRADLQLVASIVDTFRSNFPRDGNPIGNNAEITAALTGKNKLQLSLIPADHPAINSRGELCDRWGTPFFFHAESATRMEIRSAGPDKKMFSADDVVLSP